MDKETILAAARSNKHRGDEFEQKESIRSNLLSSAITLAVAGILLLVEVLAMDYWNVSLIIVILVFTGIDPLYEGLKLKRHLKTISGIIKLLVALVFVFIFIGQVVAK